MNILLYVIDSLRADHVSCYGYERNTTPNIDRLATVGIRYAKAFSPATWTKPAGASILTGAYPPIHDSRTRDDVFNSKISRLPGMLSDVGVTSVGFSTIGNISESIGYDRGFDEFYDLYKQDEIVARRKSRSTNSQVLEHETADEVALPRSEDLTERFCDWLDENEDTDFFGFCWAIDPHDPYDPPSEFDTFTDPEYSGAVDGRQDTFPEIEGQDDLEQLIGLYDGEIRYADHELGVIVDELKERGIYDETLIIVTADHGEAFNDHGRLTHGHLAYDELIHVPLIVKPPSTHETRQQPVNSVSSLIDIVPTVLSAFDIDDRPDTVQGRPLSPFGPDGSSSPVFSETQTRDAYPTFYSVRTPEWKYLKVENTGTSPSSILKALTNFYRRGKILELLSNPLYYLRRYWYSESGYLYDLSEDPDEDENVISEYLSIDEELNELLNEWLEECATLKANIADGEAYDIDRETSEQLKKLGYVD